MKSYRSGVTMVAACAWLAVAQAAETGFSEALAPADFAAAGLGKLSPQERARLDALVRDFRSGALDAARREAASAAEARAKAEARAEKAEADSRTAGAEPKGEGSLLRRAKVLLTPGTQIEYSDVEARIVGEFRGWQPRTVFTLDNGQRWQVIAGDSYVTSSEPGPKVRIVPGALGTFWMHVDGHRQRAKVTILNGGK